LRLTSELRKAWTCLREEGVGALVRAAWMFGVYNLRDKWHFVYLEFELTSRIPSIDNPGVQVSRAMPADIDRIRADIFPYLDGEQVYEKRYFDRLGESDVHCFIAESAGAIVHYSWVFTNIFDSPMMDVPFDRCRLSTGDAYVGPVFTVPGARGMTYLSVLPKLLEFIRDGGSARALVLVDGRTPAAVAFYKRLGFCVLTDIQPSGSVGGLWQRMVVGRDKEKILL
jgi:hypothetical protein